MLAMSHVSMMRKTSEDSKVKSKSLFTPWAALFVVVVSYIVGEAVSIAYGFFKNNVDMYSVLIFRLFFFLMLLAFLFSRRNFLKIEGYGFSAPNLRQLLICLVLFLPLFFTDLVFNALSVYKGSVCNLSVDEFAESLTYYLSLWPKVYGVEWIVLFINAVILSAFSEELAFRGILQPALTASPMGPVRGIIFTAVLWSALHFNAIGLIGYLSILLDGLALGVVRFIFNNIFLSIFLHCMINFGWFAMYGLFWLEH